MVVDIDEKSLKHGVLGLVIALVEIIRDALDEVVDDVLDRMINPEKWREEAEK